MSGRGRNQYTYRDAGVDIAAGNALVARLKPLAAATSRAGVGGALGGFGGLFDPRAAGYADPVLVAATDGVGTKLLLAREAGRHDTVGIDLVAMCVNDLVVQGAEPLFFLDYFSTGRLSVERAAEVIAGVARGCEIAGCALIGGETAEMPGMYADEDYDLAGFAVGAAERGTLLPRTDIAEGDVVLGLASDGLHSNGFSLVRRLVADRGLDLAAPAPFDAGLCLADGLLRPTRIYVRSCLAAKAAGAKAFAHITGGGLVENVPRVLPDGLAARLQAGSWPLAPLFRWLAETGPVAAEEMARTFNCGIGMVAIAAPQAADAVGVALREGGETVYRIGTLARRGAGEPVLIEGWEAAWHA